MRTANEIRTGATVGRVAQVIIATIALIAATPVQALSVPGVWTVTGTAGDTLALSGIRTMGLQLPKITLTASRDTIIAGMEVLGLTARRETPLDAALTVTVRITQERSWLSDTLYEVTIGAGEAAATLSLVAGSFASSVTESGNLTAAVDSVSGYDTGEATATVHVVSQEGPAMKLSFSHEEYEFAEDAEDPSVTLVARAVSGLPRAVGFRIAVPSRGRTARSPDDFDGSVRVVLFRERDFTMESGLWTARVRHSLTLVDDDVREGRESFLLFLGRSAGETPELQVSDSLGASCPDACPTPVTITDDEDIPEWELSVSSEEIREEDEESAVANVSITNGKTFAADQVVSFAFAGTATKDTDYRVAPADVDGEAPGHQTTLSAGSTSTGVTLTAVDDNIEDSNEEVRITASLAGEAIGSPQTIRILNQEEVAKITVAANRDTIIAGLEAVTLTATREAPLDAPLAVTLQLTQEQDWLSRTSYQLNFMAQGSTATLSLPTSLFSSDVNDSGILTAALDSVSGYDTGDATTSVFVVSQPGPALRATIEDASYTFREDAEDTGVTIFAWAAPGMPRGATVTLSIVSTDVTARSGDDYVRLSETITLREHDFRLVDGRWIVRPQVPVSLLDDEIREGTESFELVLEPDASQSAELLLTNPDGSACEDSSCPHPVYITDDEDIPVLELSLSEAEIREEGETSSVASVAITNGKTFADDEVVTFGLGGDAIPEHDYNVAPADADGSVADHQVTLAAGSNAAEVTFTAIDDEREEGDKKITLRVTHDGDAIGSGTIHLIDRFPGPRVEITFEGVQAPRDRYTAGVATGPFLTRFTFSEPVEGFTQEDIKWSTHSLTTIDTTNIGVLLWDYAVVREGLEYTARMMPDQDGHLRITVHPGAARSMATGDGNRLGANSLWVDLPPNRLMVVPTELTIDEGDTDGADFIVVPTSPPTGEVTVTVTGMDGTDVKVDWSTWTIRLPYWNGGWGVRVTAAHDADAANEQVRLWVRASGGGYDGRGADVVVNIRDDERASADRSRDVEPDQDELEEALNLLGGLTPELAAAALFGEHGLDETQLGALDLLGNGNGHYDLGDLLSWIARCKRGGAKCVAASSPASDSNPDAAAALAATGGTGGRSNRKQGTRGSRSNRNSRTSRGRSSSGRPDQAPDPGSGSAWYGPALRYGVVPLLATIMFWGCTDGDGLVDPRAAQSDPGYLTVELVARPAADDIGAMLVLEGPNIGSVELSGAVHSPEYELFRPDESVAARRRVIVSGPISAGPLLQFQVSDRGQLDEYRVLLLQVAGEDYTLRDLAEYAATISR